MNQPAAGTTVGAGNVESSSGYLQKNYHIDGNLYSVLTPSSAHTEKAPKSTKTRGRRKARWKLKFHHQALPPEYREHYEAATEAASFTGPFPSTSSSTSSTSTPKVGKEDHPSSNSNSPKSSKKVALPATSSPAVTMLSSPPPPLQSGVGRNSELPYMGEITLDSKPRRGRKPKKADICHLIYKNYGTVFPSPKTNTTSELSNNVEIKPKISWTKEREEKKKLLHDSLALKKSPGSSLLEKRLTASSSKLNSETNMVESVQNRICDTNKLSKTQSSLCDYLMNKNKESSESRASSSSKNLSDVESNIRDPSLAQACVQRLLAYAAGLDEQNEPLNLCTRDRLKTEPSSCSDSDPEEITKLPPGLSPIETSQPGGYVFWPSAGVFVHPQLLYKPTPPSQASVSPSTSHKSVKKKRKRSAIFIPPAESPTEVSICKFKFTGGAKPSLEEKKMLSVDAGGNFRFYSGTDKGMRSFLPHLQHSPILNSSNNSPPSRKVNLPSPEEGCMLQPSPALAPKLPMDLPPLHLAPQSPQDRKSPSDSKRKRKSRKSEVREKLEQTFKEKGFLIQTQQLESAEGATYCKFRQLRKFTRYLFRSWRDYLPHSIQDLSQANQDQQILPQDCVSVSLGDASLHSSNASS